MIKKLNNQLLFFVILIVALFFLNIAKADKVEDLKKIDQMYKEGFIDRDECITLKTGLLTKPLARSSCDRITDIQAIEKTLEKNVEAPIKSKSFLNEVSDFVNFKKIFDFNGYDLVWPKSLNINEIKNQWIWGSNWAFVGLVGCMIVLAYLVSSIKKDISSFKKTKSKNRKITIFLNKFILILNSFLGKLKKTSNIYIKDSNRLIKSANKNIKNKFEFNSKSLVVPCLIIIIGFLAIDKFGNFSFFQKDEYKNVKRNTLPKAEQMVFDCIKTYGFKKGSDKFNDCVFRLVQNDLEIQRIKMEKQIAQQRIEAERRANEAQQRLLAQQRADEANRIAQQEATLQAQRENTLRQIQAERSAAAWAELGAIGLKLLQPPQPAPRTRTTCSMMGSWMDCTTR
ncbi:hypothetical protein N8Z07_04555 [Pelagibacteraceae bacterium]|nr:hypothetical protein [Pelagibacteraceae bacterium]